MLYSRMEGAAIAVLMGGGERIADRYISHQVSPHTACGASTQPLPPPPPPLDSLSGARSRYVRTLSFEVFAKDVELEEWAGATEVVWEGLLLQCS